METSQQKLVNLFVVGSMKSGSTTLHDYLAEHPSVFMSPIKEPGYFVPELWQGKNDEYEQLFSGARYEKYLGESSTHYTKLPTYSGVPERIHHYNPNARILYVVRNPVKRTISHYLHNKRDLSGCAENRRILKALADDMTYTAYSHYAMQIRPYYKLFGSNQVFIVLFEEMIASPQLVLQDLFQWLEIDANFMSTINKKSNVAPVFAPRVRGFGLLNKLRYSPQWVWFSPFIPRKIKNLGNLMAEKTEVVGITEQEIAEVRNKLLPCYRRYIRELEDLTGKSFDVWNL